MFTRRKKVVAVVCSSLLLLCVLGSIPYMAARSRAHSLHSQNDTTTAASRPQGTPTAATTTTSTTTSTAAPVVIPIQGCWKRGQLYRVGEPIPASTDCEACYCSPGGPTCRRIECPQVALDCEPIIPKGHCCPTKYICNKTAHQEAQDTRPAFEVFGSHRNAEKYKEPQVVPRRSDGALDYGALPRPAYVPAERVAPQPAEMQGEPDSNVTDTAEKKAVTHSASSSSTTAESSSTASPHQESAVARGKQHVVYVPELIRTESGGKIMTEVKITMDHGAASGPREPAFEGREESSTVKDEPSEGHPPVSLEGLQFSELIDRLFLTRQEENEKGDDTEIEGYVQRNSPQPAYVRGNLYNASALGTSVIEARYPVDEDDELRPVYGSPTVFGRNGTEADLEVLEPRYGSPPSFVEEKVEEMPVTPLSTETTTEAVRYEPAMSLDVNASSLSPVYAVASGEDASVQKLNSATETTKGDSEVQSQQPSLEASNNTPPDGHVSRSTAVDESREPYDANGPVPSTRSPLDDVGIGTGARRTTLPTLEADTAASATTLPTEDIPSHGHGPPSLAGHSSEDALNAAENVPQQPMQENDKFHGAGGTTPNTSDSSTASVDSFAVAVAPSGDAQNTTDAGEKELATETIRVKVGNRLNVTDVDVESFRDASGPGKPRVRNIEEDGVIFSAFPEHVMQSGPPEEKGATDSPGPAESRAISSHGPSSNVHAISSVQKLFVKPTEVIKSGQHEENNGEPEVITAPNIDLSKAGSISIALSPSNSFKVISSLAFNKSKPDRSTTPTAPSVDTAPWAPLSTSEAAATSPGFRHAGSTSGHPPRAPSSVPSQSFTSGKPEDDAEATEESKQHSVLHSSFRIVPFLAEDAIFKPISTETMTQNQTSASALPRIAINSHPREPVKDNCFVGGRMFVNGELIKEEDPCDLCRCYYGQKLCQKKSCPPPPSPACFTERAPGFCCPKYTCRPEDVRIPPERLDTSHEAPRPGGFVVHQYHGGQLTYLPRRTAEPPPDTDADVSDAREPTTRRPSSSPLEGPMLPKTFFSKTSSTRSPIETTETTAQWVPETRTAAKPTAEPVPASPRDGSHSVWNILRVSGCNIYGRLYGVNEAVRELGSKCKACTCTASGVRCRETC